MHLEQRFTDKDDGALLAMRCLLTGFLDGMASVLYRGSNQEATRVIEEV